MKPILYVSVSGGQTSHYMARRIMDERADQYDIRFMFANTGCEHEKTLQFIDRCDRDLAMNITWLEAEVAEGKGNGTRYRKVTFDTASRDGRPFEDVIAKYGIPNAAAPHCNRELKAQPMAAFMRDDSQGHDYFVAIGIRADEIDRIDAQAKKKRYVYPLISWFPTMKYEVRAWWDKQPFNLGLPERLGNCVWCWKKSGRKHGQNVRADPSIYDFPLRMERLYSSVNSDRPRVFFRGNTSTEMLLCGEIKDFDKDEPNGCSESCQVFDFD